jgi:hypothetical protein
VERIAQASGHANSVILVPLYEQHAQRLDTAGRHDEAAQFRAKAESIRTAATAPELEELERVKQMAADGS